jgi:putative tricarboxylic transport membrane protein
MAVDARFIRALPYVVAGVAAGYLYYVASNFQFHVRPGTLGPDFWPQAILALMIVTCLYKIVSGLVARNDAKEVGGVLEEIVEESAGKHTAGSPLGTPIVESHPYLLIAGMALTACYVIFIQRLGFFIATVLYLALFIVLGGYRRWGVVAAVSVVGTLLLLFFFMKVVYVSLPIGQEPFSAVTLFLMRIMGIR